MRRDLLSICLIAALLVISGCAAEPAAEPEAAAEPVAERQPAPAGEPGDPSGSWAGDWGPSPNDRNAVTVDLAWDGMALTGTVNPGPDAIEIASATFDAETGAITIEADMGDLHYVFEGTMEGDSMTGSWSHENRDGDFSVTRGE